MDAVILAGGRGKRLRPFTDSVPKPLLKVREHSLLEWGLRSLPTVVNRVMIVVSYLGEQIESFMKQQNIVSDYQIVRQLPLPLGTGHALMCCREFLQSNTFLVINGDDLYDRLSLQALAETELGIMTVERSDPWRWGVVVTAADGRVTRLHEKPQEGLYLPPVLVNTGAYKFDQSVFDIDLALSERGEYEITDYVSELARQRRINPIHAAFWSSIGTPDDYAAAQKLDLEKLLFT